MTKITVKDARKKSETIPMYKLKNGEFAIVTDNQYDEYNGHLVMRTLSTRWFEVMDLTDGRENACWTSRDAEIPDPCMVLKVMPIEHMTVIVGKYEIGGAE